MSDAFGLERIELINAENIRKIFNKISQEEKDMSET